MQVTRELGLHLTPTEESITDMIASLVAVGTLEAKTR